MQGQTAETAAGSMRVAQLEGETNLLRRRVAELQKGIDRLQQVGLLAGLGSCGFGCRCGLCAC